jgi:hypothetical protein
MKYLFFAIFAISTVSALADEKKPEVKLLSISLTTTETKNFIKVENEMPRTNGGRVGTASNVEIKVKESLPELYRRIKVKMLVSGIFPNPEISKIKINPVKIGDKMLGFHAFGFGAKPRIVATSNFFTYQLKKINKISGQIDINETKEQEITVDKIKDSLGKSIELPQLGKNISLKFNENSSGSLEITIFTLPNLKPNLLYIISGLKTSGKKAEPLKAIGFIGIPPGTIHNEYDKNEKVIFCNELAIPMGHENKNGKNLFFRKIRTNIAMSSLTDKTSFKMKISIPDKKITIPFCFENIELPQEKQ